jgi:hypothetical protein
MEAVVLLPADALDAAKQIIDHAESNRVRLRLLGGLAFKLLCPSAMEPRFRRENKDIDVVGRKGDASKIMKTLETLGYKPRENFNKLNASERLIYYDMANRRRVDVFLDEFAMCHKFDFKQSLLPGTYTLPITELVMTKLQVIETTEKEFIDLVAAFRDFDVTAGKGGIDGQHIASACGKDWGLYTTFSKTLATLRRRLEPAESDDMRTVVARMARLAKMMEEEPKSLAWRIRARIGEKARWYEEPEDPGDAMLS